MLINEYDLSKHKSNALINNFRTIKNYYFFREKKEVASREFDELKNKFKSECFRIIKIKNYKDFQKRGSCVVMPYDAKQEEYEDFKNEKETFNDIDKFSTDIDKFFIIGLNDNSLRIFDSYKNNILYKSEIFRMNDDNIFDEWNLEKVGKVFHDKIENYKRYDLEMKKCENEIKNMKYVKFIDLVIPHIESDKKIFYCIMIPMTFLLCYMISNLF